MYGLSAQVGTDILLTASVYELVKERVDVQPFEATTVFGREAILNVYSLKALR